MTRLGHLTAPAGTVTAVCAVLLFLLQPLTPTAVAGRQGGEERARRREEKAQAQLERKRAAWRGLPAYELGRREALAEAAAQCAAVGKVAVPVDPAARREAGPPPDWRSAPLYSTPRARRPYVNGYLSCLRAHGHDPRYRGDLPVTPPPMPPLEDELPPESEEEREYVGQHAKELWEDGVQQCERDLRARS